MKLIYLIGIPGTGKTTVMKEFMSRFNGEWKPERVADLLDTQVNGQIRILGKYEEGETFAGTDRLSMAVAPKVIEYFNTNPDEVIVGEGDRLTSKAVFEAVDDKTIILLKVSDSERERRYVERGSNQSEKFIKTTTTKCKNIVDAFGDQQTVFGEEPGCVVEFLHETPEDTKNIADFMMKLVNIN